jgi:DNA ligase-1
MPTAWQKKNPNTSGAASAVAAPAPKKRNGSRAKTQAGSYSSSKASIEASEAPVLLAHAWTPDVDPTGRYMSEKLDGIRAWWDGKEFISRLGNVFWAPDQYKAGMPDHPLDGELYLGRGRFQETMSIVRTQNRDTYDKWKAVRYMVFDAPEHEGTFLNRYAYFTGLCDSIPHATAVNHVHCKGEAHLQQELIAVERQGGEGVMLRDPNSKYVAGRHNSLLKVKSFFDAECTIVGTYPGRGKYKGMLGGYECVQHKTMTVQIGGKTATIKQGVEFKVGGGKITDEHRRNPLPIGTVITYRFVELTKGEIPRHAGFLAVRDYE